MHCYLLKWVKISFLLTLFLFPNLLWANEPPLFRIQGSGGLGMLATSNSIRARFAGVLDLFFSVQCKRGVFCEKYQPNIFTTELRFALGNDSLSSYVPYVDASLRGFQVGMKPWLKVGAGLFHLQRNPRFLDTTVNLTVQLGEVRFFRFREFARGSWECGASISALGGKYADRRTSSPSFAGLALLGIMPSCQVQVGKQKVKWDLGFKLGMQTSVGASGHGRADAPGPFGAMLFEPWTELWTQLRIRLNKQADSEIQWYVRGDFRYQTLIDTGTQGLDMSFVATVTSGLAF